MPMTHNDLVRNGTKYKAIKVFESEKNFSEIRLDKKTVATESKTILKQQPSQHQF
jgi:hypothetical protein